MSACRKKILDILAEGIRFLTFDVDRPHDAGQGSIEDRHNDLGAGAAKRGQITGIGGDVAQIDDPALRHGCAGESFGEWEGGMFGLPGSTPRYVPHQAGVSVGLPW